MIDKKYCSNGGCMAKLGSATLNKILSQITTYKDPHLLVGYDHSDDGAVYQINDHQAIITTLDFFPMMIEDPYIFGKIAACNAVSDIYAMGGKVLSALNIVCFPEQEDMNILGKILEGGAEVLLQIEATLAGGHSIFDPKVKYGLSVTGIVDPKKMWKNQGVHDDDVLLLTKPIGAGICLSGYRMDALSRKELDEVITSMTTVNKYASEILQKYHVHACTDITGFGLLGHLKEMIDKDHTANINANDVPVFTHAKHLAEEFYISSAGQRNRNSCQNHVCFNNVDFAMEEILFDPQTSGGLLVSVSRHEADKIIKDFSNCGLLCAKIGTITKRKDYAIIVNG